MTAPPPKIGQRPTHPKAKAFFLMIGVLIAVTGLAAMSTFAGH